jgi:ABC-type sugar transport system substrate-binding protein
MTTRSVRWLAVAGALMLAAGPASATLDMQKKAKAAGFAESTNCLYCHGEKLPKKGAVTNNDRGKFLVAEKEKQKAKEVDVTWLKNFTEKK